MIKTQQDMAMDNLIAIQSLLGQLGFTLHSGNAYYKDYANSDGTCIRLKPILDEGISIDTHRKLKGFDISVHLIMPVIEGIVFNANDFKIDTLPLECANDMATIVSTLSPLSKPMTESFMVTMKCSMCGKDTESYMYINGNYSCTECVGFKNE